MVVRAKTWSLVFSLLLQGSLTFSCRGQQAYGTSYLKPVQTIPLDNVHGRIDHLSINIKKQIVYIAALGNNSVEVVDLSSGRHLRSIDGLKEPQGVVYIPNTREIMVANGGNGRCIFYNAETYDKTATVSLSSDADDVRYDDLAGIVYVGYGSGGVAAIDVHSHKKIRDYPVPAHPEAFEIDPVSKKLYVNVPGADRIDVFDLLKSDPVAEWKNGLLSLPKANFPMALDTAGHRLFIGYRDPAMLVVLDSRSGKKLASPDITRDPDDLYYDAHSRRIYISGGGGSVNIFKAENVHTYHQIANIT